ncbi:hypothetical protein [Xanthomonas phaseoli]|uniref:hypothetical protein n=1 Tax=Xanthomonas phaseoli TaxID=1985254 RepID=UPI001237E268|nr:hypothetical protein [Xanthomonas phaseoli]MBO9831203.1 hypothetical protein [Xanthomonas phaseoli pv. dieffenbachiae]MBO9837538.1 hypothetical protein [Xanthomonas phaseoli pv. dieffenbachiae]MBO9839222.1 hypothetical protein [Xanthomonas phaseoli pv. dieffenbachiae]MBO9861173.1 hypothetical protein [Xanthomonas phaseoli pv. dieffenbachiae]MBO9865049.1 hypothetical protein [Xanthomonas phaseoli pv. dieffenbachiae]
MQSLPESLFGVYALALPRGHGFGSRPPTGAWTTSDHLACGVLRRDEIDMGLGVLVMRRRVDHVWTVTADEWGFPDEDVAKTRIAELLREGEPAEPLPAGVRKRAALNDLQHRSASDIFKLLGSKTHHPAAWMLNQLYLSLPNPDANWAADCQTNNFHTRLWEAQLLGSFREQGLIVTQPFDSPDFRIENRHGGAAWVEAVTANPEIAYNHVNAPPSSPPPLGEDIFFGPAALRFAKTLGNKLQRRYAGLPHVAGQPFMIAVADFQAPGSMTWSREGLIGYLYGIGAEIAESDGRKQARTLSASLLKGPSAFAAGLFANDQHSELSAVIFSNACSLGKFNRVAITTLGAPPGLRYMRIGKFFDRTPGALEGIPFCLDVTSDEYKSLWPGGHEPWSAELEVFHNPFARHPVNFDLLPEATHWFEQDGELICSTMYEHSILWSRTMILNADDTVPTLQDFMAETEPEK